MILFLSPSLSLPLRKRIDLAAAYRVSLFITCWSHFYLYNTVYVH